MTLQRSSVPGGDVRAWNTNSKGGKNNMLEKIKFYLMNVALQKYAPIGAMAALTAVGTFMAAHAGMLETWGVNYIATWTPDWVATHPITGPVLLVELDTTSVALIGLVTTLAAMAFRATEHHVAVTMTTPKVTPEVQPNA